MRYFLNICTLISVFGCAILVSLTTASAGTLNLNVENDRIANTDRHYSNGVRLGWVSDVEDGSDMPEVRKALQLLYPLADVRGGRLGLEMGHNIYTPSDTEARNLITTDRPYAGWLYASASLYAETDKGIGDQFSETLDKMALEFGIVGPAALGREVQNNYHKLIGVETSKGWDHQLGNEPGINLSGERQWRHKPFRFGGFEADAIPHLGASLGNVYTHLNGGMIFRVGQELYVDYGPPLIRPSLSGFGAINPTERLAWYAFAGFDGRWVLRNIFLDGNTFSNSHSVDKKPLVGDFVAGVAVTYKQVRFAFTHVMRTREFDGQAEPDRFGSVSISVNF